MSLPVRLGPYVVDRVLGQGGMGVVYAVHDPLAPRVLALKMIRAHDADEVTLERFWREAEVLARVRHRGVVRVHRTGRLPEGPFLLSDLVEGQPLSALVARGPLAPREAARIARELADAVEAVHAAGALHRDLKPGNVILRPDGIPVLLDFGLARDGAAKRLTLTGQMLGTPCYMAPEQAGGDSPTTFGPPVDVYGLGAILYELLTGRPPFEGESPLGTMKAILTREPTWPAALRPDVPPALDAIVRRSLAKAPRGRYLTAAALREDLDRFLADLRVEAESRRSPARRAPGRLVAAGLVLVVAAVTATAMLLPGRGVAPAAGLAPASPAPRALASPPTPTPTPPPTPTPRAWPLAPGDALALTYSMQEDDGRTRVRLELDLDWRVEALEGDVARVRATFAEAAATCGPSGGDLGGFSGSTRAHAALDDAGPLGALLAQIKGVTFELGLVTTTGEVRALRGTAELAAALRRGTPGAPVGEATFRVHEYLRNVVAEAPLRASLDALCRVDGEASGLERRLTVRGAGARSVVVRGPASGFVLDTLISPFGQGGRVEVRGESAYEEGRLLTSRLEQVLVKAARGDVTQRSTIRAALSAR